MNNLKKWTTVFFSHDDVSYRGLIVEEHEVFYRVLLRRKLVKGNLIHYRANRYFFVRKERIRTLS